MAPGSRVDVCVPLPSTVRADTRRNLLASSESATNCDMSLSVLARLGGRGLVAVALTAAVFLAVAPAQADKREDKAEDKTADRRDEKRGARDEKRARRQG